MAIIRNMSAKQDLPDPDILHRLVELDKKRADKAIAKWEQNQKAIRRNPKIKTA